jgi:hypothetical protein
MKNIQLGSWQKKVAKGFPGNLGSIDYMHWVGRIAPFAWQGLYKEHKMIHEFVELQFI